MVETPMRYGFILSPEIKGLDIPLVTFKPEDLVDLHEKIEYWLSHEDERRMKVTECAEHVLRHDTWSIRIEQILKMVLPNALQ
jgi:glycosyltransferase involved in cell wall biosynthesis